MLKYTSVQQNDCRRLISICLLRHLVCNNTYDHNDRVHSNLNEWNNISTHVCVHSSLNLKKHRSTKYFQYLKFLLQNWLYFCLWLLLVYRGKGNHAGIFPQNKVQFPKCWYLQKNWHLFNKISHTFWNCKGLFLKKYAITACLPYFHQMLSKVWHYKCHHHLGLLVKKCHT